MVETKELRDLNVGDRFTLNGVEYFLVIDGYGKHCAPRLGCVDTETKEVEKLYHITDVCVKE